MALCLIPSSSRQTLFKPLGWKRRREGGKLPIIESSCYISEESGRSGLWVDFVVFKPPRDTKGGSLFDLWWWKNKGMGLQLEIEAYKIRYFSNVGCLYHWQSTLEMSNLISLLASLHTSAARVRIVILHILNV